MDPRLTITFRISMIWTIFGMVGKLFEINCQAHHQYLSFPGKCFVFGVPVSWFHVCRFKRLCDVFCLVYYWRKQFKKILLFSLSRLPLFLFYSVFKHPKFHHFEDESTLRSALRGEIVGLGIVVVQSLQEHHNIDVTRAESLFQISFYLNFGFVFVLNRFAYSARPGFLIEVL